MIPSGAAAAAVRAIAAVPVVLLVLFTGVLWLLGLMCGRERRRYVTILSQQALEAARDLLHGTKKGKR